MKKLHLLVLKAFIGPFLLTFLISNFLFLMIWLFKYIEDFIGKGLELSVLLEVIGYSAINQIPFSLPLAMLLSSIMTLGNLGETNELTAIKSLGISMLKAIRPLTFITIGLSIGAYITANHILPVTNLKARSLLEDIMKKRPELNIPQGVFYNGIPDYNLYVAKKNEKNELIDVMIHDHKDPLKNNNVTVAKKGIMESTADKKTLIIRLQDGYTLKEEDYRKDSKIKTYPLIRCNFEEQIIKFDMSKLSFSKGDGSLFKQQAQMMNKDQLLEAMDSTEVARSQRTKKLYDSINRTYFFKEDSVITYETSDIIPINIYAAMDTMDYERRKKIVNHSIQLVRGSITQVNACLSNIQVKDSIIRRYKIEFHKKFTLATACLVLFFIGAPFGAITRKGGLAWPVVYSILLFLVYWVLNISFEKLAKKGSFDVDWGMWMANLILFPVGIYLTNRATKDLPLLPRWKFKKKKNESTSNMQ